MAILSLIKTPDEFLRKKSKKVEEFDARLGLLLDDMSETLKKAHDGIGLAAVQVGFLKRLFIVDYGGEYIEFINPEILEHSENKLNYEACLSVTGREGYVKRPRKVTVKWQDRFGEFHERQFKGYISYVIGHEFDHIEGVLFIDKLVEKPKKNVTEAEAE
ncbi:MAG: peptide deformylase [Firmicutes bacterium]|nr:peptide deformylase [Bacillota bacterium]